MFVGCVVLMNVLIAMLSTTYSNVLEHATDEWRLERLQVYIQYHGLYIASWYIYSIMVYI